MLRPTRFSQKRSSPTHNSAPTLKASVTSVLGQTKVNILTLKKESVQQILGSNFQLG